MRCVTTIAVVLAASLVATSAHADPETADELFAEGKRLLDAGDLVPACEKLAMSQQLDPSSGTLLNLAHCHERQGRVATARSEYLAAAKLAREQGRDDRAEVAEAKASAVATRVPKLTILVRSPASGQEVRRDDVVVPESSFGVALDVDPGAHTIEATAPQRRPFTANIPLNEGESRIVEVFALEPTEALPTAVPPPGSKPRRSAPPRGEPGGGEGPPLGSWILAGASLASFGVGAGFGVASLSAYEEAESSCNDHVGCSQGAVDAGNRADSFGWVSNIAIGAGVVALGAAAVVWIVHPSGEVKSGAESRVVPTAQGLRVSF